MPHNPQPSPRPVPGGDDALKPRHELRCPKAPAPRHRAGDLARPSPILTPPTHDQRTPNAPNATSCRRRSRPLGPELSFHRHTSPPPPSNPALGRQSHASRKSNPTHPSRSVLIPHSPDPSHTPNCPLPTTHRPRLRSHNLARPRHNPAISRRNPIGVRGDSSESFRSPVPILRSLSNPRPDPIKPFNPHSRNSTAAMGGPIPSKALKPNESLTLRWVVNSIKKPIFLKPFKGSPDLPVANLRRCAAGFAQS